MRSNSHYREHVYEQAFDSWTPPNQSIQIGHYRDDENLSDQNLPPQYPSGQIFSILDSTSAQTVQSSEPESDTARPIQFKHFRPANPSISLPLPVPDKVRFQIPATTNNIVPFASDLQKYGYDIPEEHIKSSFGIVAMNYRRYEPGPSPARYREHSLAEFHFSLVFKKDFDHYPRKIPVASVFLPGLRAHHQFALTKSKQKGNFQPIKEYYATVRACFSFCPDFTDDEAKEFVTELKSCVKTGDKKRFLAITDRVNNIFRVAVVLRPTTDILDCIFNQVYGRCVSSCLRILRRYAKTEETFGEFMPAFVDEILTEVVAITPKSVVLDLGCGVGQLLVQIVLENLCLGYGIEIREELVGIADEFLKQALLQAQLWGLAPGGMKVYCGDFTKDDRVPRLLEMSDLVIINNEKFGSELCQAVAMLLVEHMKSSCVVVVKKQLLEQSATRSGRRLKLGHGV
ncbi:Nucleosomal histone H3-Lys79 methylase [Marasmius tenuissimus]|uniref:Histone-lysine N-methyltransferase, H3 lysine-79 specific n=1 Tax=Marasmius tenuissimus TaxID=585030 RepID=A0ABR3AFD3_9AGAR